MVCSRYESASRVWMHRTAYGRIERCDCWDPLTSLIHVGAEVLFCGPGGRGSAPVSIPNAPRNLSRLLTRRVWSRAVRIVIRGVVEEGRRLRRPRAVKNLWVHQTFPISRNTAGTEPRPPLLVFHVEQGVDAGLSYRSTGDERMSLYRTGRAGLRTRLYR
ncbi:MAG: hypothetical protein RL326_793 [Pseudomonadota bacterium]